MKPHELLQLIFNASELAALNGRDRDMVRDAAKQLAAFIEEHAKEVPASTPPCPTTPQS